MKVILFRHAKSSWADPALADIDRPLNARGRNAAPLMARWLLEFGLAPDLVLCSAAVRTRQTLDLVLAAASGADWKHSVQFDDALYLAEPDVIRARLTNLPAAVRQVIVVGHNPGLHELALLLSGKGEPAALAAMARKFPTAAAAVIDFAGIDAWPGVVPASGELHSFMTPAMLMARPDRNTAE